MEGLDILERLKVDCMVVNEVGVFSYTSTNQVTRRLVKVGRTNVIVFVLIKWTLPPIYFTCLARA